MKRLKYSDLTPEIMKDIEGLETAAAVVAYFDGLGFSISEKGAAKLIDQIRKVKELSLEDLKKVAGGSMMYPETHQEAPFCPNCGGSYTYFEPDLCLVCEECGYRTYDW